jgi:hypothetical protein
MRAQGLGAGALFEALNFGFRKGRGPYKKTVADALVTHRLVQTKNPSAWVVRISFGNFVFVGTFGQLRGLRKASRTRAIHGSGRGSAW